MLRQFWIVLKSYNRPLHWLVVAVLPLFVILFPAQSDVSGFSNAWLYFFVLTLLVAGLVGVLVGSQTASVLTPARSRLIPGFVRAHFAVAALLTTLVVVAALHIGGILAPDPVSYIGQGGIAVALVLLGISLALGPGPGAVIVQTSLAFLPILAINYPPLGEAINALGRAVVVEGKLNAILPLIFLDCLGVIALVHRARRLHEESPAVVRAAWLADLQAGRALAPAPEKALNRIDRWVAQCLTEPDARSRLRREFMIALPSPGSYSVKNVAIVIAVGWAINLALRLKSGSSFWHTGYVMLGIFLLSVLVAGLSLVEWRRRLQSMLLLPMRRRDLIFNLGSALVSSCLRSGFVFATGAWVLESIPTPFEIRGAAPVWPIVAIWSLQFPLLALLSLAILSRSTVVGVIVAIGVLWTLVMCVLMAITGSSVEVSILALAIGTALLFLSYRLWLDVETQ